MNAIFQQLKSWLQANLLPAIAIVSVLILCLVGILIAGSLPRARSAESVAPPPIAPLTITEPPLKSLPTPTLVVPTNAVALSTALPTPIPTLAASSTPPVQIITATIVADAPITTTTKITAAEPEQQAAVVSAPLLNTDTQVEAWLANMTLDQKIGQMLMVGLPTTFVDEVARQRIVDQGVGGVILLGQNTNSPDQTRNLNRDLQQLATVPLFIAWNLEGGSVTRFAAGVTHFPSQMAVGATGNVEMARTVGKAIGEEMLNLGVNMNYAPVLDVNREPNNPVIGTRSYGSATGLVAGMGSAFIDGIQTAGVIAVAKHFPGHGNVTVDSHLALPTLLDSYDTITSEDLPPFEAAISADVGGMMVAHLDVPSLDGSRTPTSLSKPTLDMLRKNAGYNGVIMTDDIGMGAIINSYGIADAAVRAVQAGNDMILTVDVGGVSAEIIRAVRNAVNTGAISSEQIDASARRLLRLKANYLLTPPATVDWATLQNQHVQLAYDVGKAAVQIETNGTQTLPLNLPTRSMLLITPSNIHSGSAQGDGRTLLGELLSNCGIQVNEVLYTYHDPTSVYAARDAAIVARNSADVVVIVTWDAILRVNQRNDSSQVDLVNALTTAQSSPILVHGNLPYDNILFPNAPLHLNMYGSTAGQIAGIADALAGVCQ